MSYERTEESAGTTRLQKRRRGAGRCGQIVSFLLMLAVVLAGTLSGGKAQAAGTKNVAKLTIVANDNGVKDLGHAFLVISNTSSGTQYVGPYILKKGHQVTIGLRGGINAHFANTGGAYYNYEAAYAGVYKSCAYKTIPITADDLQTISYQMRKNSYYENLADGMLHNCTTFAVRTWNKVAPKSDQIKEGLIDIPNTLKKHIETMDGSSSGKFSDSGLLDGTFKTQDIFYLTLEGEMIPYKLQRANINKIEATTCGWIDVKWAPKKKDIGVGMPNLTGYEITCEGGDTTKSIQVDDKKTEYTITGLKSDTEYQVGVRLLYEKNGFKIKGEYSPVRSATTKKCKVTMSQTTMTLDLGRQKTGKLTAKSNTRDSQGIHDKVSWKSSQPSVASVSKGKVTAKNPGTAIITATIHGQKATCKVTVKGEPYKALYKKLLEKGSYTYKDKYGSHTSPIRSFYLLDVNRDGTPELICKDTEAAGYFADVYVFTVKNRKLICCGFYYSKGYSSLNYSKKYKALYNWGWINGIGGSWSSLERISGAKPKLKGWKFAGSGSESYGSSKMVYRTGTDSVNCKKVSKKALNSFVKKYFNNKDIKSYTYLNNNEVNRKKKLG